MTAAYHIKTKKGENFILVDDRFYVLLNRIVGEFLTPEERYSDDRIETGKKYGNAIGKLHKVFKKQNENIDVNDSNLYQTVIDWVLPETTRIMEQWRYPLPNEFFDDYMVNFKKLYPKLPRHVIHRDTNPFKLTLQSNFPSKLKPHFC